MIDPLKSCSDGAFKKWQYKGPLDIKEFQIDQSLAIKELVTDGYEIYNG